MNLLRARLVEGNIGQTDLRVLSPADTLLDILTRAATSRTRSNLRWGMRCLANHRSQSKAQLGAVSGNREQFEVGNADGQAFSAT